MIESATRANLLRGAGGCAVRAALPPARRSRHGSCAGRRRRLQLRARPLRLLLVLDDPQSGNVLLVLLVGFRKSMPAGAVGDEIRLLRARWVGGRLNRTAARIGDGAAR